MSAQNLPVLIIDDGNDASLAREIASFHDETRHVYVLRREINGGKGAAVKTGLQKAGELEWTHAVQIDADGQHDLDALDTMITCSRMAPSAIICGVPIYDSSIPKGRKIGREITHFWVRVETLSFEISDSMCGFRIYPLAETLAVMKREYIGARMDFDTEILVQLNWRGLRVVEHPVSVIYPAENVSNFRMLRDNVRISLMHTRLALQMPLRVPIRMLRRALSQRYPKPAPAE